MGIKKWEYERCINILTMLSLDQIIGQDADGFDVTLGEKIPDTRVNNYYKILEIILSLTRNEREHKIISLLAEDYQLPEIAKKINCPRTTINRILKRFRKRIPADLKKSLFRGEV
jgi:DNA-directed RNA polymerase specialized sigma subunit